MNGPTWQKHFSEHQNAEEAHAHNTLTWVQVIQGHFLSFLLISMSPKGGAWSLEMVLDQGEILVKN